MSESKPTQKCKQCGTCCRKSSPSFHKEDKPLIEKGVIPSKHLFTIRKGEPAYENVKGGENVKGKLMPVDLNASEMHTQMRPYHCCLVGTEPGPMTGDIAGKINMGVGGINACVICRRWPEGT